MSTEATKQQSIHYGCLVIDGQTGAVNHYVEKPSSYVSTFINCGIYVCSLDVFTRIATVFHSRDLSYSHGNGQNRDQGYIEWEREILTNLAGTGQMFALPVSVKYLFSCGYFRKFVLKSHFKSTGKQLVVTDKNSRCCNICESTIFVSVQMHTFRKFSKIRNPRNG